MATPTHKSERERANDYSKVVNLNGNCDETKSKKNIAQKKKNVKIALKLHSKRASERDSCSWSG